MLLGHSLARLSRAVGQTADLSELLKVNLDAMKVLAATHAAQSVLTHQHRYVRLRPRRFMTAAAELVPEPEVEEESESNTQ